MPSEITTTLTNLLGDNSGAPFLFIGSGFSRRYIGLEQWNELLRRFCREIKDFGYYSSQHNQNLPKAASEIARDFNEVWWSSGAYEASRSANSGNIKNVSSALKYEIATYLSEISHNKSTDENLVKELESLSRINVDGIITTNWDLFLEELFPDYKVFVGQEELLFSNPQSIAEIYKIHGCASQPNSLVLTNEDYEEFESRNAYLAAKLITIFIEHPVIFIGYSISDENIQNIISSIVKCLGQEKLDAFGRNLIFVQRTKDGEAASIQPSLMAIGPVRLTITIIKTSNYLDVYSAIESTKRKIPARILRYCKEQMYDLVKSSNPETRLAVADIDQIERKEDVEFVMGVGLVKKFQEGLSAEGYKGVTIDDIFSDIIEDTDKYDPPELFRKVYPSLTKRPNKYIPIYRYLRKVGINSIADLRASEFATLEELLTRNKRSDYISGYAAKQHKNLFQEASTTHLIETLTAEKAALHIPCQEDKRIEIATCRAFLLKNRDNLKSENNSYSTYFRKLACLIDLLEFGF